MEKLNHLLVQLDNEHIEFRIDENAYSIPRSHIESKFNLYWMMGALYDEVIVRFQKDPKWFNTYKQ